MCGYIATLPNVCDKKICIFVLHDYGATFQRSWNALGIYAIFNHYGDEQLHCNVAMSKIMKFAHLKSSVYLLYFWSLFLFVSDLKFTIKPFDKNFQFRDFRKKFNKNF